MKRKKDPAEQLVDYVYDQYGYATYRNGRVKLQAIHVGKNDLLLAIRKFFPPVKTKEKPCNPTK